MIEASRSSRRLFQIVLAIGITAENHLSPIVATNKIILSLMATNEPRLQPRWCFSNSIERVARLELTIDGSGE
jgi:hypothetical protein